MRFRTRSMLEGLKSRIPAIAVALLVWSASGASAATVPPVGASAAPAITLDVPPVDPIGNPSGLPPQNPYDPDPIIPPYSPAPGGLGSP